MNNSWYSVKAKFTKQLEDGRLKRVTDHFLFDSVSFTDAEARCYEEVGSNVKGGFSITAIKKENFADIFHYEDSETWYKVKVSYLSSDADSGKEKKISHLMLVTASSVKEATVRLLESLADMMVTLEVLSVTKTDIVEIFPYTPDDSEGNEADVSVEKEEA